MFSANRDNILLVAVFLALVTCFYLFRENKKTKTEIASFKALLNKPSVVPQTVPVKPPVKTPVKTKVPPPVPPPSVDDENEIESEE